MAIFSFDAKGYCCEKCGLRFPYTDDGYASAIDHENSHTSVTRSCRYRINVSQTSTGKYSWECTVEAEGEPMGNVLTTSDRLVAELKLRYPPEPEKKAAKETVKPPQAEGLGTPEQENATTGKAQS